MQSIDDFVIHLYHWYLEIGVPELDRVGNDLLLHLRLHKFVASVVVQCRVNVEALLCYVVPGLVCCGFGVDKDSSAHGV